MENAWEKWQAENDVKLIDPTRDALYNFDAAEQKKIKDDKPWRRDPHHFKNVRISAIALLKMVIHARSGGELEVMGLMMGSVHGDTFVVTDAFRLPVEGTETRVNAQDEANEYMVTYLEAMRDSGREENPLGWYHSHPGYGCWLSGIDVQTQFTQQAYNEPFLAIVIDPDRTMSTGKVEIGAFRTYPEDYKPAGTLDGDGFQTIPMEKMQDFGLHSDKYYSLDVSYFKSTLDSHLLSALWNKYWVSTLSANPLLTNRDYGTKQIMDLASKIKDATRSQGEQRAAGSGGPLQSRRTGIDGMAPDAKLEKIMKASSKIEVEHRSGQMASTVKSRVFGSGSSKQE